MPYDESWDRPHGPGAQALWQESDCYWFYDAGRRVGGFHRIGQRPNAGTGSVMLFVFDENGERYLSIREAPVSDADRWKTGHRVAGSAAESLGGLQMRFSWDEPETAAELAFYESFYLPRDWSRRGRGASVERLMNPEGHLECSGRIRGKLRIGERAVDLDALAHRDRSWGSRDVATVAQHRMFSGTVGPELSWAVFVLQLKEAGSHVSGFVARGSEEIDVAALHVLVTVDNDGLTMAGATAKLALEDGSRLEIPCRGVQGFVSDTNGYVSTDTIATVSLDGRSGFCDLEVANNPTRGRYVPTPAEVGFVCVEPGLSKTRRYEW